MDSMPSIKPTVLLVDDEVQILRSITRLCRSQPWCLLTAESGALALDILAQGNIDLLLTDMRMPEMSGAELLQQVAVDYPDLPCVVMSGYSDFEQIVMAINTGNIHAYICKPWENDKLLATISRVLRLQFLEDERDRLQELSDQLDDSCKQLRQAETSSIVLFSQLLEMRTGSEGRGKRLASEAKKLGLAMGLQGQPLRQLLIAAMLSRIGTMSLNDQLMSKSRSNFSIAEKLEFETHTDIGADFLRRVEGWEEAAVAVQQQLEYFDGQGVPNKLFGCQISLAARILTLVGDCDDLRTGRLGDGCANLEQLQDYLHLHSGSRYDPELVASYSSLLAPEDDIINAQKILLRSVDLRVDMVLAEDLVASNGVKLLARGRSLDASNIEHIQDFERTHKLLLQLQILATPSQEIRRSSGGSE